MPDTEGWRSDTCCDSCQVEWAHFHAGLWCWICGLEGRSKFGRPMTVEEQADAQIDAFLTAGRNRP